ncbi:MAG: transposase [Bdellovibrionota bacterium]|nr:transposase [Bdellovibrionota bacterium]
MPRLPLIYTHELPYHITARTNNQEWFQLPLREVWNIFTSNLRYINRKFGFQIHAFVLMNNHYHLIGTCSENHNLAEVMGVFQTITAKEINIKSGNINHVYGKRYRASLIGDQFYYGAALKYVFRNPVTAKLCPKVENWQYSTVSSFQLKSYAKIPISCHYFEKPLVLFEKNLCSWFNDDFYDKDYIKIKQGLSKSRFKFPKRSGNLDRFL